MASVKLLEFEQLVEEKETRLDFQVAEFLAERNRRIHQIESLTRTRENITQYIDKKWEKIVLQYEYKQRGLYNLLKILAGKYTKLFFDQESLKNYNLILLKNEALIKSYGELDNTYTLTIDALKKLKEYLINNYGVNGYVELNERLQIFDEAKTNWDISLQAQERSESEDCPRKERSILNKLVAYIESGNNYKEEIYKINALLKRYSKLQKCIPNNRRRMDEDFSTSKYNRLETEKAIKNLTDSIEEKKKTVLEIVGSLDEDVFEEIARQNEKIQGYKEEITQFEKQIKGVQLSMNHFQMKLSEAYKMRESLKEQGRKFNQCTPPDKINRHEFKFNNNEKTIRWAKEKIEKLRNSQSWCCDRINERKEWIKACEKTKQIKREANKIFRTQFLKDFKEVETITKKMIDEALYGKKN